MSALRTRHGMFAGPVVLPCGRHAAGRLRAALGATLARRGRFSRAIKFHDPGLVTAAGLPHRGDEALGSTWSYLDLTALGRQEEWEDSPEGCPRTRTYEWWSRHDEYETRADPWEGRLDEKVAAAKVPARTSGDDAS